MGLALAPVLVAVLIPGCRKEEQAVVGVAQTAVKAQQQAQAAATERDQQRAALSAIPLPTKSMYVDVHEASAWANPFLSVDADRLTLRILLPDTNSSAAAQGSMLRPEGARRQEIPLRPGDVVKALIALPPGAWRYGRVVAIAESPAANQKDQPKVRRNVEAAIQQLNDLGIVVYEWPAR